jgi:heme exporter protein CcmD
MGNTFWIMEDYNIYIWSSYFLTLFSLLYLLLLSFYKSKKAKKLLNKLIKSDI